MRIAIKLNLLLICKESNSSSSFIAPPIPASSAPHENAAFSGWAGVKGNTTVQGVVQTDHHRAVFSHGKRDIGRPVAQSRASSDFSRCLPPVSSGL
ncbi:hypothetical protein TNCV_436541, partial [Trichonephila clavipes]